MKKRNLQFPNLSFLSVGTFSKSSKSGLDGLLCAPIASCTPPIMTVVTWNHMVFLHSRGQVLYLSCLALDPSAWHDADLTVNAQQISDE